MNIPKEVSNNSYKSVKNKISYLQFVVKNISDFIQAKVLSSFFNFNQKPFQEFVKIVQNNIFGIC